MIHEELTALYFPLDGLAANGQTLRSRSEGFSACIRGFFFNRPAGVAESRRAATSRVPVNVSTAINRPPFAGSLWGLTRGLTHGTMAFGMGFMLVRIKGSE